MAAGFGLAGAVTSLDIADAVNAKLPEAEQVNSLGWYPSKTLSLLRLYRELYPEGVMVRRLGAFACLGTASIVAAAAIIGFALPLIVFLGGGTAVILWYTFYRRTGR